MGRTRLAVPLPRPADLRRPMPGLRKPWTFIVRRLGVDALKAAFFSHVLQGAAARKGLTPGANDL